MIFDRDAFNNRTLNMYKLAAVTLLVPIAGATVVTLSTFAFPHPAITPTPLKAELESPKFCAQYENPAPAVVGRRYKALLTGEEQSFASPGDIAQRCVKQAHIRTAPKVASIS